MEEIDRKTALKALLAVAAGAAATAVPLAPAQAESCASSRHKPVIAAKYGIPPRALARVLPELTDPRDWAEVHAERAMIADALAYYETRPGQVEARRDGLEAQIERVREALAVLDDAIAKVQSGGGDPTTPGK